ncbi:MAG: hypothetical protein FD153_1626, partial [Rhodospirillaceae bacterium]
MINVAEPVLLVRPYDNTLTFLQLLDPTGLHNLVAIHPVTGQVTGCTFGPRAWEEMRAWIAARGGAENLYFSPNELDCTAPDAKLSKADIGRLRAVWVDIDPRPDAPLEAERKRLQDVVNDAMQSECPPTIALDSGGGVQLFWFLGIKISVDAAQRELAERQGKALAQKFSADTTQNIDRIMRLPGTLNILTAAKLARGRVKAPARIIAFSRRRYTPEALAQYAPTGGSTDTTALAIHQFRMAFQRRGSGRHAWMILTMRWMPCVN